MQYHGIFRILFIFMVICTYLAWYQYTFDVKHLYCNVHDISINVSREKLQGIPFERLFVYLYLVYVHTLRCQPPLLRTLPHWRDRATPAPHDSPRCCPRKNGRHRRTRRAWGVQRCPPGDKLLAGMTRDHSIGTSQYGTAANLS